MHNTNAKGYALRHGDWVLIDTKSGGVTKVPEWVNEANGYNQNTHPGELYILKNDLGQKHNLYGEKPEIVADLKERLKKVHFAGQVR